MDIATDRGQDLLAPPLPELLRRHRQSTTAYRQSEVTLAVHNAALAIAITRQTFRIAYALIADIDPSNNVHLVAVENDAGELLWDNYDHTTGGIDFGRHGYNVADLIADAQWQDWSLFTELDLNDFGDIRRSRLQLGPHPVPLVPNTGNPDDPHSSLAGLTIWTAHPSGRSEEHASTRYIITYTDRHCPHHPSLTGPHACLTPTSDLDADEFQHRLARSLEIVLNPYWDRSTIGHSLPRFLISGYAFQLHPGADERHPPQLRLI